jgi:hypothetical protein
MKKRQKQKQKQKKYKSQADSVRKEQTYEALRGFRTALSASKTRMAVLREYANKVLPCVDGYGGTRSAATKSRITWHVEHRGEMCIVGCGRPMTQAHHVIQIQHGGADVTRNKVPVCDVCHADIHPWIPVEAPIYALKPMWG